MPDPESSAAAQPVGFATPEEALASTRSLREKLARVADRTPSTVVDAFAPDPLDVAGIELKPIRMRTWLCLEKIDSPFIHGAGGEVTIEDLLRALYVITQPAAEVRAALRGGEAALSEAVDAFAERIPLVALPQITAKLAGHLAAEFSPRADLVRDEEGSGTGPKPPAFSATAPGAG
ncbi:MAG: hypothetical protein LV481_12710 [Methylacidiphilales bacterium]|nr:hypothetical protein [Candidatus Methylacidiphilales bacterium]